MTKRSRRDRDAALNVLPVSEPEVESNTVVSTDPFELYSDDRWFEIMAECDDDITG